MIELSKLSSDDQKVPNAKENDDDNVYSPLEEQTNANNNNNRRTDAFIGTYEEADAFLLSNEHLRTGYRINFNTYHLCTKSIFMWHNETINVCNHGCGGIIFIALIIYTFMALQPSSLQGNTMLDRWISKFDEGRFDDLTKCEASTEFSDRKDQQTCQVTREALLDDILESNKVLQWLESEEG